MSSPTPAEIKDIIAGASTYQILAIWSPDLASILLAYAFAALLKVSLAFMLRAEAVERTWVGARREEKKDGIEVADAKARLAVPAKAACVDVCFWQHRESTYMHTPPCAAD